MNLENVLASRSSRMKASEIRELLKLLEEANEEDLVICLTSGGGSALLEALPRGISLDNLRKTVQVLLASGVGPRLALALLSTLGSARVVRALRQEDLAVLCTVPGVGKKKAERMVLELRDRIRDLEVTGEPDGPGPVGEQAITALVNLGYNQQQADAAVRKILASNASAETGTLLREALQELTTTS